MLGSNFAGEEKTEGLRWQTERAAIVDGLDYVPFASGAIAGPLLVTSEQAFPVVLGRDGSTSQPAIAAAVWERGRVIALGHEQGFLVEAILQTSEGRLFLANCLRWLGANRGPLVVACFGVSPVTRLLSQPTDSPLPEDLVVRPIRDLGTISAQALSGVDVLVLSSHRLDQASIPLVQDFIRHGGGVLVGGLGWGWLQLNPGKTLDKDFPGNRLLADAGIYWLDGYLDCTSPRGFSTKLRPQPEHNLEEAINLLTGALSLPRQQSTTSLQQALRTVTKAQEILPPEHPLMAGFFKKLNGLRVVPSPEQSIRENDIAARLALTMQIRQGLRLPADAVRAHPAAEVFPGSVPPRTRHVRKTVAIDPSLPGWQSTGLYAPPGQTVTVEFPADQTPPDWALQIGCHTDTLWNHAEWKRVPELVRREPLQSSPLRVANPFGGLLYIVVSNPRSGVASVPFTIDGAVEAPLYVDGKTSRRGWNGLRMAPGPWAELASSKIVLTFPSRYVRGLANPGAVMSFWNAVIDACNELAGKPPQVGPQRIVCDEQISAGYMHSGYPIMVHLDIAPVLVDLDAIRGNRHGGVWGLFHELGHNYQSPDWTFTGTGEVTCNLFSVYVFDHLCRVPRDQYHPALKREDRLRRVAQYMQSGPNFARWQSDPFLALDMYLELQEAFGWEPFRKTFAEYHKLSAEERPRSDSQKIDQFMIRLSRQVGRNLAPFFTRWGLPLSQEAVDAVANLPVWQGPMW